MIRTSTVVYILLLLVLVGAYVYLKNREQPAADIELTVEPGSELTYLFPAEEGTPSSIRIEAKSGGIVEVARDADNAWAITAPIEAKADQAAAEAAASQVTTMQVLDSVPDVDAKIVGLDDPEYILTANFTSGGERTVDIGVITPTESGYYVRDTTGKVVIVSRSSVESLLGLLDNPPYLETPSPSPIPATETPTQIPTLPEVGTSASATATP